MKTSLVRCAVLATLCQLSPAIAIVATATTLAAWTFPAQAQARSITTNRMLGEWKTSYGLLRIERHGMRQYYASLVPARGTQPRYAATLEPSLDGLTLGGYLRAYGDEASLIGLARVGFDRSGERLIFTLDNNRTPELTLLTGESTGVLPWLERDFQSWFGTWETSFGRLTLEPEGAHIIGSVTTPATAAQPETTTTVVLAPDQYFHAGRLDGAWETLALPSRAQGQLVWNLASDRLGWTGVRTQPPSTGEQPWNGQRVAGPAKPAPPAIPSPTTPPPQQAPATAYQPLRRVSVRLDSLVEARGYPTRQVHALVTIRNVSTSQQYITSGFLRAVLTDTDGVTQERNQVWRASGEPAALFNSTPVVQPGAELKVRYVFNPDEGSTPATFRLSEGDKVAEFQARAS